MTEFQKVVKYISILLAALLAIAIIAGIIRLIGGIFFAGDDVLDEFYEIEISQNLTEIDIEIGAASFKIEEGDRFALSTNLKRLNVTSSESRLYVEQSQKLVSVHSTRCGEVILTVPKDAAFEIFELSAGAGEVIIGDLKADRIDLEFGAGRVEIGNLSAAQSARIETGAGNMNIQNGDIRGLDLDLGVGEASIRSYLTGNCTINCGVGKTNVTVIGDESDYTVSINTGIGDVRINGADVKGNTTVGNGAHRLDIDGGIGAISIEFEND